MPNEPELSRICVYAGAQFGGSERYQEAARDLGRALARRGYELVYGGGGIGLMGTLADATLSAGGSVIGIIPERLAGRELAHKRLTRLEIVATMHERKRRMAELSGAFVALPGGLGTLEELFEAVTLTQLGYHSKPVGLFNCLGYYDGLVAFLEHAVREGFIKKSHARLFVVDDDSDRLISRIEQWLKMVSSDLRRSSMS